MLEEPIKEGVPPKMKGSVLMCVADTEEEVLDRVKKDVYYTSDVWDKEKVSAAGLGGDSVRMEERLSVRNCLLTFLSRFRSFRSRALLGRLLSERGKMKSRHAR